MVNEVIQFVFAILVIVSGAAMEDLLPKALGVGFPLLLAAVPFVAARRSRLEGAAFAFAAGAMEEALSSLPPLSAVSFFLVIAVLVRQRVPGGVLAVLAYPVYQIWLSVWLVDIGGSVFGRILLSFPIGFATMFAVSAAMDLLCRKAAIDEQG